MYALTSLPGCTQRPDWTVTLCLSHSDETSKIYSKIEKHTLNQLGMIPVVSTFTGAARTLLGIAHAIFHLTAALFSSQRREHLKEVEVGFYNLFRGLIEIIPIVNFTASLIDVVKIHRYSSKMHEQISLDPESYHNTISVFSNGTETFKRALSPAEQMKTSEPNFKIDDLVLEEKSSTAIVPDLSFLLDPPSPTQIICSMKSEEKNRFFWHLYNEIKPALSQERDIWGCGEKSYLGVDGYNATLDQIKRALSAHKLERESA